jgi:hypothetical protein
MIESGLTQSRRATKAGIPHDPVVLRVFVPSCESMAGDDDVLQSGRISGSVDWQVL